MEKNDLFLFTYLNISIRIYQISYKTGWNPKLIFVYQGIIKKNRHLENTGKETADYIDRHVVEAMVEVAKQKMYSEEEVIDIAKQAFVLGKDFGLIGTFNEWFDTVKKK